ncbi:hypothetical protein [Mycetocola sp.]|uniref:hypothetical protein n=1 Tax=Mycetocola sp. TaxID=1871042 RepID=UPI00398903BE
MTDRDYSALTRPVTPQEVKEFRRWARSSGWIHTARAPVSPLTVIVALVGGIVAFIVLGSFFTVFASIFTRGTAAEGIGTVAVPVLFTAIAAGLAGTAWRSWTGTAKTWDKHLRLRQFAAARRSTYVGHLPDPAYPGMIFGIGTFRSVYDSVRADTGRPLEAANYRYTVRRDKGSTVYRWGYLALQLDRRLPHMVLDARSNNLLFGSNLPRRFGKDSVLSLEGDFDRHFTLYCPPEYGRDALYVFTPDLMALLIDESSAFDVEIVDDWMFVYSTQPFDLVQPAVWQRLDRIVDTVGSKTLCQTARYADERVSDPRLNIVAPQGRRLRRGIAPGAIVMSVIGIGSVAAFHALRIWG